MCNAAVAPHTPRAGLVCLSKLAVLVVSHVQVWVAYPVPRSQLTYSTVWIGHVEGLIPRPRWDSLGTSTPATLTEFVPAYIEYSGAPPVC